MMKSFLQNRKLKWPKTVIKKKKKKKQRERERERENFSHNDYLIVRVLLTQKLIHLYLLIL